MTRVNLLTLIGSLIVLKIKSGIGESENEEQVHPTLQLVFTDELYCPSEGIYEVNYGQFEFPQTSASVVGTVAHAPCPYSELNTGATYFGAEILRKNIKKINKNLTGGRRTCYAILPLSTTDTITTLWDEFSFHGCRSMTMDLAIKTVDSFTLNPVTEYNVKQLMPRLPPLSRNTPSDYKSAETMVGAINHALEAVELFSDGDLIMLQIRDELFTHLSQYTAKVNLSMGQKVQVSASDIIVESVVFPDDNKDYEYRFESFQIPSEALQMARMKTKAARLQISGYSDTLFRHWGTGRDWDDEANGTNLNGTNIAFLGPWRVYDVQFAGVEIANLTSPISYTMPVNESEEFYWICAFWNSKEELWSTDGMKTTHFLNSVRCESTHLTAFSVLIDPRPKNDIDILIPTEMKNYILSVISSVGSTLSIAGLSLTIVTYSIFRTLRRERSSQILINLSLSLSHLHVSSLLAGKDSWDGYCTVPSALLHYFLFTSLGWMLVDAIFMYRLLISVFVQPESMFLRKRMLLVWGIPLGFVVGTALIDSKLYTEGRNQLCVIAGHLNLPLYYATYFSPAICMILINAFVFARIILVLYQQNKRKRKEFYLGKRKNGPKPSILSPIQIKGAISLFVVLGVGWMLGFLAVGPLELPLRYVYTILNSGQGLLIFIFRVVLETRVIRAVRQTLLSESESSFGSGTTGTVVTGGHGPRVSGYDNRNSVNSSFSVSPIFSSSAPPSATKTTRRAEAFQKKIEAKLNTILKSPSLEVSGKKY